MIKKGMIAITTSDNPYNPLTHFDEWYEFDREKGYHTCSYLARMCHSSDSLSDSDQHETLEAAIDDIVKHNILGIVTKNAVNYVKVVV